MTKRPRSDADMTAPWMKFYPADWRADPRLRMCSLAARGLWIDLICYMHEGEPYGHLTVNGAPPELADIAALLGRPLAEVRRAFAELETRQVFSRDTQTHPGAIFSRRMLRDRARADRDRANGRTGGNPKLRAGVNAGDNPSLNGADKAQNPEARIQKPDSSLVDGRFADLAGGRFANAKFGDGAIEDRGLRDARVRDETLGDARLGDETLGDETLGNAVPGNAALENARLADLKSESSKSAAATVAGARFADPKPDGAQPAPDAAFAAFQKAYPTRKGGNPWAPARKLFDALVASGVDPQAMIAAAKAGAGFDRDKIGTQYIPQAATWLRERRFADHTPPQQVVAPKVFIREDDPRFAAWLAYLGKASVPIVNGGWYFDAPSPPSSPDDSSPTGKDTP